jgi:hypothetical protein
MPRMTSRLTTLNCWKGPTTAWTALSGMPIFRWDKPAAGGAPGGWRHWPGDEATLDDDHLRELAGTFSRRLTAYCAQPDVPLLEAHAGERKHELAAPCLPSAPHVQGLFLVITGKAPAPVWEVKRNAHNQSVALRHRRQWPQVKHYYFPRIDAAWGQVTLRLCGDPPLGAQVMLNGHQWVERPARRQSVVTVKAGNCFVAGSDCGEINRVAARLQRAAAVGPLAAVGEQWLHSSVLCFGLTREEPQRSGFQYQYSVFPLEWSRNLLFHHGPTLEEVYQKLSARPSKQSGEAWNRRWPRRCKRTAMT